MLLKLFNLIFRCFTFDFSVAKLSGLLRNFIKKQNHDLLLVRIIFEYFKINIASLIFIILMQSLAWQLWLILIIFIL